MLGKPDPLAQTGRTTRMLQYAIEQAAMHKRYVTIVCATADQMRFIRANMLDSVAKAMDIPKLKRARGRAVMKKRISLTTLAHQPFDFENLRLPRADPNDLVLYDHFALGIFYRNARKYLEVFKGLKDPIEWMAYTARFMRNQDKAVYIVSDNDRTVVDLGANLVDYYDIKIEHGRLDTKSFDWHEFKMHKKAWTNCEVIFDPQSVAIRYSKVVEEMHRWDK